MPLKLPKPTEKQIQNQILDWLRLMGGFVVRINSGAMRGDHKGKRWYMRFNDTPGCSDILGVWRGRALAVEVKRPGGKLTEHQERFLDAWQRAGGLAVVADSLDGLRAVLECRNELIAGKM